LLRPQCRIGLSYRHDAPAIRKVTKTNRPAYASRPVKFIVKPRDQGQTGTVRHW